MLFFLMFENKMKSTELMKIMIKDCVEILKDKSIAIFLWNASCLLELQNSGDF